MEAVLVAHAQNQNQHINHYKQIRNQKRNNSMNRSSISRPTENFGPTGNIHGGLLMGHLPHPYLSYSLPPPGNPIFNHPLQMQLNPHQPPLLPLPISRPYSSMPSRTNNRTTSLTPKKPKQPMKRKEDLKPTTTKTQAISDCLVMASSKPSGPDPSGLPKDVSRVQLPSARGNGGGGQDLDQFSGSVFTLSPPPSSLPLPKFLPRPKLCCKAEAAGVDTGATDNLRQMLRLR